MQKVSLSAKDYASRQELDDYVRNNLGDDISVNRSAGHTISGTIDELKALGLSENVRVFGVKILLN